MAKQKTHKADKKTEQQLPIPRTLPTLQQTFGANTRVFSSMLKNNSCEIKPWLKALSTTGQANLESKFDQLRRLSQTDWHKPNPASKVAKSKTTLTNNIYVIRSKDENSSQHRIFGYFSKNQDVFVLTLTGYEKDDRYHPDNYDTKADKLATWCQEAENWHTTTNPYGRTIPCLFANNFSPDQIASARDSGRVHAECLDCIV